MPQPPPGNDWLGALVSGSVKELGVILGAMKLDGTTPDDFVFVIVDTSDEAGRHFAKQVKPKIADEDTRLISAVPKHELISLLNGMKADALAARIRDEQRPPATLTVLAVSRGMAQSAHMPMAFLPPPPPNPEAETKAEPTEKP